jgi:hypothetical protein
VHRCSESGTSIRGKRHEPPLTVLADEELPELTDPVESDDDPVPEEDEDGDGVAVTDVVPVDDVTDDFDALLADVPACVAADATARAATAALPATPNDIVSPRRRRSARSRSSTVMRRFGAGITALACECGGGREWSASCAATAAHLGYR